MSSPQPSTAVATVDPRQRTLKDLFERSRTSIEQVVPKHLTVDRILKVALSATSRTPRLLECTPSSVLASVMQAATLGLEPGTSLGHCYLVPFWNNKVKSFECTLIIGYRGFIELARRSGDISFIEARCVYEKDHFRVSYGLIPVLEHIPTLTGEPGKLVAVYALARIRGSAEPLVEVMTRAQVDTLHQRTKKSDAESPWDTDYDEMARKTVVRRIFKYCPVSVELADAMDSEDESRRRLDDAAPLAVPLVIADPTMPALAAGDPPVVVEARPPMQEAEVVERPAAAPQQPAAAAPATAPAAAGIGEWIRRLNEAPNKKAVDDIGTQFSRQRPEPSGTDRDAFAGAFKARKAAVAKAPNGDAQASLPTTGPAREPGQEG